MAAQNTMGDLGINPFQNIALAFSGGGFRAAAFSLGTLSYLEHLKLNGVPSTRNIRFISSASGGTITNLLYTSAIHRGECFTAFYAGAKDKLTGDALLKKVLSLLNDNAAWNGQDSEKRQNLINAFARVYDTELFDGETMAVYANKNHVKKFEVCCNATEFYRGLNFRFQTDGTRRRDQLVGNRYLSFDVERLDTLQKVKLADILAASSCFPMGFEPLTFPEDFTYADFKGSLTSAELRDAVCYENYNEIKRHLSDTPPSGIETNPTQPSFIKSFGLMDGGITDNQALNSLMTADKKRRRKSKPDPFDMMIVTDVASYFMDYYNAPVTKPAAKWRNKTVDYNIKLLQRLVKLPLAVQYICGSLAPLLFLGGIYFEAAWASITAFMLSGVCFGFFSLAFFLRHYRATREILSQPQAFDPIKLLRNQLPLKSFSDGIINQLLNYFRFTKLNILEQMLKARISSVMSMVMDVNLKQVRRLIFQIFYNDECWDNRRVPNFIYELSTHNAASRTNRLNDPARLQWKATDEDKALLNEGLENMAAIAESSRKMGTTLWFDKEDMQQDQLANIIKSGQFTTCMNLLEYVISLERKKVKFDPLQKEFLKQVKQQLIDDITRFKDNPSYLFT